MKTRLITMDDVVYGNVLALSRGGGFAPIGAESYFDGSTPPTGWLICDGSTKNISDYPDLANYFQSQHGSKSYYGGNGSTTFGVPKRCGMPDGCDYESTTEHIVGVDKDNKPIYEKSGTFTSPTNNHPKNIFTLPSSNCIIKNINGEMVYSDGATRIPLVFVYQSSYQISTFQNGQYIQMAVSDAATWQGRSGRISVKYTKSSDSAVPWGKSADKNGIFCIKATIAGHTFSTTEHEVGTWINGNTLWEKTVSTGGAVPSGATEIYRQQMTGYDTVWYTKA